jgi:hypothetical protein
MTVDSRHLEYVYSIEVMNQCNWCEFVLNYFILAMKKLGGGPGRRLHCLYGIMLLPVVSKEDQNNTCSPAVYLQNCFVNLHIFEIYFYTDNIF